MNNLIPVSVEPTVLSSDLDEGKDENTLQIHTNFSGCLQEKENFDYFKQFIKEDGIIIECAEINEESTGLLSVLKCVKKDGTRLELITVPTIICCLLENGYNFEVLCQSSLFDKMPEFCDGVISITNKTKMKVR